MMDGGYILGDGELRPGERKLVAVENFPRPNNQHKLRRFLGLTGFFRRFVQDFSKIAAPLTKLLKKEQPFIWHDDQGNAFQILKASLVKRPVLQMHNPNAAKTELHTDASAWARIPAAGREGSFFTEMLNF